ncbi:DUF1517 domain-containing protein [Alkalinema sp. FACHB-956]|uniref:DUF1517 domain-containing protein n=1 Tax=Alkalinema sp. FACHB-956 TaxID=2692768 RepID=UPI00168607DA|nr:DUF1517 domain-containing protein [Alkalinema sp. FACHB-956]MBD2327694.1 DUF1517 domain-containing protein [Alkalinema sp. FACHB-956]
MKTRFTHFLKPLLKPILAIALIFTLFFGAVDQAQAASYGGRMGGGSFRSAPSRTYSAPRSYGGGYGGGGYYGGGGSSFFFFPSPWMFFWGGGGAFGGLFTVLIFVAIANFAFRALRNAQSGDGESLGASTVSVTKLQVGLLAQARELQSDLNRIAQRADTSSSAGLAQVLQESTLSLMRHPEYWVYAGGETKNAGLTAAEAEFNRIALAERSKFKGESLSNVSGQLKQADSSSLTVAQKGDLATQAPGEYIVVTLVVGAEGKVDLPKITSADDVRKALSALGSVSSDRLMALEVLWTPQVEGDVFTSDDMIVSYPTLKLV